MLLKMLLAMELMLVGLVVAGALLELPHAPVG